MKKMKKIIIKLKIALKIYHKMKLSLIIKIRRIKKTIVVKKNNKKMNKMIKIKILKMTKKLYKKLVKNNKKMMEITSLKKYQKSL